MKIEELVGQLKTLHGLGKFIVFVMRFIIIASKLWKEFFEEKHPIFSHKRALSP